MSPRRTWAFLAVLAAFIGAAALSMVTPRRSVGAGIALAAAGVMTFLAWQRARTEQAPVDRASGTINAPLDPSRRRFIAAAGASGLVAAGSGAVVGNGLRHLIPPTPHEAMEQMGRDLGEGYMELVRRGFYEGRSGELDLIVYPFNSANYSDESRSLVRDDPRSSHAAPWLYLERIPLVLHAPGRIVGGEVHDRVTLADIAPTTAQLCGNTDFVAPDGTALASPSPRNLQPPPKVVVTFVIDGGGWNVLHQWPDAWPNLRRLMGEGINYTNAIHGSNPAVTACAHATIGTGAFPRTHGISGHFIRFPDGDVAKAYGEDGEADTSVILTPTFAEHWQEQTGNQAWVGEIGYQIWHLGMIGKPDGYRGQKPVAVFYDEDHTGLWQPQNPDTYRLPAVVPPRSVLEAKLQAYVGPSDGAQFTPRGGASSCCAPPIIEYQGDLIVATLDAEPVGQTEATSLLTINFKAPDYAGHIYNMLNPHEEAALQAVDNELGRLVDELDRRFPGDYALIVTADHGQCPAVTQSGGVRLDPVQLANDINERFGQVVPAVQDVRPAEVYLQKAAMRNDPQLADRIAAWLRTYTYGDNVMKYQGLPNDAIQWRQMKHLEFAAVFSGPFVQSLCRDQSLSRFGPGVYSAITDTAMPL